MAQQKNKSILTRLISKVHSMLTQLNRNTAAIKSKGEKDLSNVSKADALAKLGITQAQLEQAIILSSKTLVQTTLEFDDGTTKPTFTLE